MSGKDFQIHLDDETCQKIEELKGYIGMEYDDADVIIHAINFLYWEYAPEEVKTRRVFDMRNDLRQFIDHGMDNVIRLEGGEEVPGLEKLEPSQVAFVKGWLATSMANINLLEMLLDLDKQTQ